jgi:hypothetical protein
MLTISFWKLGGKYHFAHDSVTNIPRINSYAVFVQNFISVAGVVIWHGHEERV